jgi:hypothetical protein
VAPRRLRVLHSMWISICSTFASNGFRLAVDDYSACPLSMPQMPGAVLGLVVGEMGLREPRESS